MLYTLYHLTHSDKWEIVAQIEYCLVWIHTEEVRSEFQIKCVSL